MNELSDRLSSLSPQQKELLMRRLRERRDSGADTRIVPRAGGADQVPLSFAQQRLWFVERLEPGGFAYNITIPTRFTGPLDAGTLAKALNEIARRHEVLRTAFAEHDGKPVQIVAPSLEVSLPAVDLSRLTCDEMDAEVKRLATEEMQRPFDLARAPAWRCVLLRLGEQEHVLVLTIHHIVTDAWSTGLFFRELTELYEAFSANRLPRLAALPIQYADFAEWQREWLTSEEGQSQLSYWKRQLAGRLAVLELPTDRPRPDVRTSRGATHVARLPARLTRSLKELSRDRGATLFMTLLAAFGLLLHRYTGQEEIVVGTDVANRNRRETEALIGFFINILVLRMSLSGDPNFCELLDRVRELSMAAYAHQDVPFDRLVVELGAAREANRAPLFQVLFVMQNAPQPALEWAGLCLSPVDLEAQTARFDLAVFVEETAEGLIAEWNYSTDLFEAATVRRFAESFEALLDSVVARPGAKLSALDARTEAERRRQEAAEREAERSSLLRFKSVRPKAVQVVEREPVRIGYLPSGTSTPLVLSPALEDVDVAAWARSHRPFMQSKLLAHGALLLRGFGLRSAADFERCASAICPELFAEYGDLPREEVGGKVYGSTPYPSNRPILFHNESSHLHRWPMKIWFYCARVAEQGGETPVVDCRRVYRLLPPATRERFARRGLMYVRNFTEGLDVNWQDFFRTNDRAEVARQCREAGIECEWRGDKGLRTRKVAVAVAEHPHTGETVFFNQIQLHHIYHLPAEVRRPLLDMLGEEGMPRNVYYGDGGRIEDEVLQEVEEAYRQAVVSFRWAEGDVLMLDNMLTAHGRNPYTGERKILVAMGEMSGHGRDGANRAA